MATLPQAKSSPIRLRWLRRYCHRCSSGRVPSILHSLSPAAFGRADPAEWSDAGKWTPVQRTQLEQSDVISFHNYSWPEDFEAHVTALQRLQRPILCTEFMARSAGSTFDTILPIAKKYKVAAINWGFVAGKTQTIYPWESWQHPYVHTQPPVWFHDIFKADGTPYRERETQLIRELTSESNQQKAQVSQ